MPSTTSTGWSPRPSTSCAKWRASAQPGAAVLRRQGFHRAPAPGREGLPPGRFPFPLLHIDTGHNYPEVIDFRDARACELNERLIVRSVESSMARGTVRLKSADESRNKHQSVTLLEAIEEFGFDACIGGARRDEEKARAKERIFSFRDEFGGWDPKNQRPELWDLFNARVHKGENIRAFPISNWTELDVWQYIEREGWPCRRSTSPTRAR
jgi:sulfate adenylyltransferase subunit 2